MPVRKFRRIDDMESPLWREPGDSRLYKAIAAVWDFGSRTTPRRYPPGVFKRRSIEEMNRAEEAWAESNFRALQDRRSQQ